MITDAHVHTQGSRKYPLSGAILLYGSQVAGADLYATVHGIRRGNGTAELDAGAPATLDSCRAFARAIADKAAFSGFLSPELLYVGPRLVAWWRAPARARVWFSTKDEKDPKRHIGERTAITPHPGLVFVVWEGQWFVYALRGDNRPGPQTPLYRAPYFNVWIDGRICEGNLERPKVVTPETISRFEQAFFESRFTHSNVQNSRDITKHPAGIYGLWRELLDGKSKTKVFPDTHLVAHGKATLASQLRAIEEGRR